MPGLYAPGDFDIAASPWAPPNADALAASRTEAGTWCMVSVVQRSTFQWIRWCAALSRGLASVGKLLPRSIR